MIIKALELQDILELMAMDIDNDDAFIRVDGVASNSQALKDDQPVSKSVYMGPFSLYDPYH